jgi:hypothetical protein
MQRYNAPNPMSHWTRQSLIAAVVLVCALAAAAASFTDPAAQMARDIAAVTGPGSVAITVHNTSSLTHEEAGQVRHEIEKQLRDAGVRSTSEASAVAEISLTLSENAQGYLWVAEIRQGSDIRVVMRSVPRAQPAASAAAPKARVTLRQTLLYSQQRPILDVAVFGAGTPNAQLAVLDDDKVALYRVSATSSEPLQSLPVTHSRPWPRDLRGRLLPATDHLFDVWLPGVVCSSTAAAPLAINCRESDDPWPLDQPQPAQKGHSPGIAPGAQSAFYGSARDFFTGVIQPGIGKQTDVPPFYSAAALDRGTYTLWMTSGVDSKVRQFDSINDRVVSSAADWGSDLAAVKSSCGQFVLATADGDSTAPDRLRAYEIADREPALVSAPLEFAGPVTALWPGSDTQSQPGQGAGTTANVVVHNLKTDEYEAYNITLACNQ